ncbi:hypothetical protein [Moorena sp. SIO4G3]|nr:hypothetical protein [Moorena sp. SIO4G3]NEO75886.1 hypothetical protein [Moorena sp. SIO4G3]
MYKTKKLLFPVPCSLFPVPCSLFPVPCSLPLKINFQLGAISEYNQ